ncbi:MAG: response regulator [Elusimicrobiota bacterium]|nr:response regulator [Elusimicrobiota bacterium]
MDKKRILVVDDDQSVVAYLEFLLSIYGYVMEGASSGEEALKKLEQCIPDLIFLDLMMPKMSGYEVCRRIRSNPRTSAIPVILYTASRIGPEEKAKGIELGADDFLSKPFNTQELKARLDRLFKRRTEDMGYNPLTKLPGNLFIEKEFRNRLNRKGFFAFCYLDIDNFKGYNDLYGFKKGDDAILFTADVLKKAIEAAGNPDDFVGHIGGDDFIFVTTVEKLAAVCEYATKRFDKLVFQYYDEEDVKRGYITSRDREDKLKNFPLMTVSIGVLTNEKTAFPPLSAVVEKMTELKSKAKKDPNRPKGSFVVIF